MPADRFFQIASHGVIGALALSCVMGLLGLTLPAFGYFPALGSEVFHLKAWQDLWQVPGLWGSVMLSFYTGLLATALALGVSFLLLAASFGTRSFARLKNILAPFLAIPHAALALGLVMVLSPSGLIFRVMDFSRPPDLPLPNDPWALSLIFGLIVKEVPFLLLVSLAALSHIAAAKQMAMVRSLAYGPMIGFAKIIFPQIYGRIRLPILAVLAYSAAPPDMALILGPQDPPLLLVHILRLMAHADLNQRFVASAAGLVQLLVMVGLILSWLIAERIFAKAWQYWAENGRRKFFDIFWQLLAIFFGLLLVSILLLSFGVLGLWSIAEAWRFPDLLPSGIDFSHWQRGLSNLAQAFITSLWIGAWVAGLAIILATICLQKPKAWHGIVLYAPLLLPQVSLLLGLQVLGFESVIFAHLLYVLAYVHLALSGPWQKLDQRYLHVAASLGASDWQQLFGVKLRLLAPQIAIAFAIGFAVSISLYLPSLWMGGGRIVTLTMEAVTAASGGDRRFIAISALLQSILPLLVFALVMRLVRSIGRKWRGMGVEL